MSEPLLSVRELDVTYHVRSGALSALRGVSFDLDRGEILGVVGESGCGKSTLSAALLRLLPANGEISGGQILLEGRDIVAMTQRELRALRGRKIAMIFQDPLTSLNPTFTVGTQLIAAQRAHATGPEQRKRDLRRRAMEMLTRVGMPDAHERIDYYPHQFSGGMRQRIMIAMALLLQPDLLIADEATSALDVTLQAQILELFRQLRAEQNTSMIFISHDLGVVSEICDRVVVMYAGRTVEQAPVGGLMREPKHPYTKALLASVPTMDRRGERLATIPGRVPSLSAAPLACTFAERCPVAQPGCHEVAPSYTRLQGRREVRCHIYDPASAYDRDLLAADDSCRPEGGTPGASPRVASSSAVLVRLENVETHFAEHPTLSGRVMRRERKAVRAVDGVDLEIRRGEIVGLVGESGSGKTTLGRSILGLVPVTGGRIRYDGRDMVGMARKDLQRMRRHIQMIFQDSHASLSPRRRVSQLLVEPYTINGTPPGERISVPDLLDMVQLSAEQGEKYPHELSGGQARRVGIARALALRPEFIVADEPTAGLDVSAGASVLNLMKDLAAEFELTYLIITHDLNTVGYIADRIALMYLGRLVETGPTEQIFAAPSHPYTRGLMDAVSVPDPDRPARSHRLLLAGEIPSPKDPPPGCRFHTRCRFATDRSRTVVPQLETVTGDHLVACHNWEAIASDPDQAFRQASQQADAEIPELGGRPA